MYCPSCGHKNNDLATVCSACGSALAGVAPLTNGGVDPDATVGWQESTQEHTLQRVPVELPGDATLGAPPQPVPVTTAPSGNVETSKLAAVTSFLRAHEKAFGLGIAVLVVVIMGAVWAVRTFTDVPSYGQIQSDIGAQIPSYDYIGGTYGVDATVPLSNVSVTKRERVNTPSDLEASADKGRGAYRVEAEVTFMDSNLSITRVVGATYVHNDEGWVIASELDDEGVSFTARAGVDESKVIQNKDLVLKAADEDGTLTEIYRDATCSISANSFEEMHDQDTATDDVVLSLNAPDTFFTYSGKVTAQFAFENGEWKLRSATADQTATHRSYDALLGTWTGELLTHAASTGARCYAAREHPFLLTIDSIGEPTEDGRLVKGTLTGVAHYHEPLEHKRDEGEGDMAFEQVTFTGTIPASYDADTTGDLEIACETAESSYGELRIELRFGTANDPSAAEVSVMTSFDYEGHFAWFIPTQETVTYTDTYTLSRSF